MTELLPPFQNADRFNFSRYVNLSTWVRVYKLLQIVANYCFSAGEPVHQQWEDHKIIESFNISDAAWPDEEPGTSPFWAEIASTSNQRDKIVIRESYVTMVILQSSSWTR
jgi:hypothetical protein